jgi:hypothetical protein
MKQNYNFVILHGCETWSLILRREIQIKVIWEQSAEENIWT